MGDLLFQSSICFVNWSIKSRPVLPYGTKKVFFLHVVTSLYYYFIIITIIIIITTTTTTNKSEKKRKKNVNALELVL